MAASQMMMSHDIHSHDTPPPSRSDTSSFDVQILVEAIILMALSSLAMACQLLRAWLVKRKFEKQEWYLFIAWAAGTAMSSACAIMTTKGLGKHDYNGDIDINVSFQQAIIIINCLYFMCNFCVKMALLAMYRKFTMEIWGKWVILFMECTSVMFWLGSIFTEVFQCVPLTAVWNRQVVGQCVDLATFYHANAAIMIAVDLVLYGIPLVFTRRAGMQKMSKGERAGVRIVFALGFVCVSASCARFYIVHLVIRDGDMPYNYGRCLFASALENHIAIVVACAGGIKGLVGRALSPTSRQSSNNGSKSSLNSKARSSNSSAQPSPTWHKFSTSATSSFSSHRKISQLLHLNKNTPYESNSLEIEDIELGFHETSCEFMPNMKTTCTSGSDTPPQRPISSKSKIYASRKITITEEFCDAPIPKLSIGSPKNRNSGTENWSPREFADLYGADDEADGEAEVVNVIGGKSATFAAVHGDDHTLVESTPSLGSLSELAETEVAPVSHELDTAK